MMPAEKAAETTEAPASAGASAPPELSVELSGWWRQIKSILHDQLQLFTLEGERAANSVMALLAYSLLVGLLGLALWLGLLAQVIMLAQHTALEAWQSLGLAMVVNLFGLWYVLRRRRHYSRLLRFPATRHSLRPIAEDTEEH